MGISSENCLIPFPDKSRLDTASGVPHCRAMPLIELRLESGSRSAGDLLLSVQDKTYDYLMVSPAAEIRVSAYLDRDWPEVQAQYAEIFVNDSCAFECKVVQVIPGSRTRTKVTLPGEMHEGEQLVVIVSRKPIPRGV